MSYSKISILVPTRNRIEYLKKMFKSCEDTVGEPSRIEFVFRIDNDDTASADFLASSGWPVLVGPRLDGYKSLPRFYNEMVTRASGDVFICGNDDMIFLTPDWPRLILEEANKYPDGIFNVGVSTGLNDDKFPFSIVSRHLVERLGKINDERLIFSDVFLLDVARHFNRAIFLPSVLFYHDWTGFSNDRTRQEASAHEYSEVWEGAPGTWTAAYTAIHNMAVGEAVAKLDPMRGIRDNN